jgi:hypothetical protein
MQELRRLFSLVELSRILRRINVPNPRAATSVATKTAARPLRNAVILKTQNE